MYPASDTVHKVTSTLCYGVQWDAALNFIDSNYEKGNATGYVKDSTGTGNYTGTLATTGSNTAYQQKHIYDMAGNVWELSMEAYNANTRVSRGGYYNPRGGNLLPVCVRDNNSPDITSNYIGFRVSLYLPPTSSTSKVEVSTITQKVDKNTPAEDSLGNPIVIPEGFKVVPDGQDGVEYKYTGDKKSVCMDTCRKY